MGWIKKKFLKIQERDEYFFLSYIKINEIQNFRCRHYSRSHLLFSYKTLQTYFIKIIEIIIDKNI